MAPNERPQSFERTAHAHVERRFSAMGSEAHVVVVGWQANELAHLAEWRIRCLEDRWSRFREESEVSRVNAQAGDWVTVSDDTMRLIDRSLAAWRMTNGAFDPTLLSAVRAVGYDRSFEELPDRITIDTPACGSVTNLAAGRIEVDRARQQIRIPVGVGIDPGGIGKGLAADMVTEDLIAAGADGVLVNLGGDIRVAGSPPRTSEDGRWSISIDDPFHPERELARIALDEGAVATSSRLKRRWHAHFTGADDGVFEGDAPAEVHHLLDPRTRRSASAELASVTVCAGEGWWAEAQTKQVFVAGRDDLEDALERAPSIVVDAEGVAHASASLREALAT